MLASFSTHFHNSSNLSAGVLGIVVVEHIFENGEVVLSAGTVHVIVDSNKAYIVGRKNEILKATHVGIFTAKTAQIFDDQGRNSVVLHIFHHLLKTGSVEICSRISVIHKEHNIAKSLFGCVFAEQGFLRRDLSRCFSSKEYNVLV